MMKALITRVKSPNVRMFTGRDNNKRIGFRKIFNKPKIKEAIRAVQIVSTLIPDRI